MKHHPRKRFGQHFLVDEAAIATIVAALAPARGDRMVEIGPGRGALTTPLVGVLDHLYAIEIDRDLVRRLRAAFPAQKLTIHACDALKFDFGALGNDLRVVGNLPYNISTPLLFHLADYAANIRDLHFMLQKEVVERMVAAPASANYGRLSVMLQYRFALEMLFTVAAHAFHPAPEVQSAVVRLVPRKPLQPAARDETWLARVVSAAFAQRRKTLRNALKALLSGEGFATLGIDPSARAQELSVAQFVAIADFVAARA